MKQKRSILFIALMITFTVMSLQANHSTIIGSGQATEDIRVNRLILQSENLTFKENDTFFVYMSLERLSFENIYDVNFNITAKDNSYEIESSTNTTNTNKEFVTYYFEKLERYDIVSFNMTLRIISNESSKTEMLEELRIDYKFGENKVPDYLLVPEFSFNIKNPVFDKRELKERIFGVIESDLAFFSLIIVLPIIVALLLSFLFGRRQNK